MPGPQRPQEKGRTTMTSRLCLGFVLVILTSAMLVQPARVEAQCMTGGPIVNPVLPNISVYRVLATMVVCRSTMNMNVNGCFPTTVPQSTVFLVASAPAAAMSASCAWTCACPGSPNQAFSTTNDDGLPVELLDFKVSALEIDPGPEIKRGGYRK